MDVDKIECESCGSHLSFSLLPSWSPTEGLAIQFNFLFLSCFSIPFFSPFSKEENLLVSEPFRGTIKKTKTVTWQNFQVIELKAAGSLEDRRSSYQRKKRKGGEGGGGKDS